MNDKIRQLAEQASHQSPDGYPVTIPYSKDFAEKFAELIVKELLQTCEDHPGWSGRMIGEQIKLKFGVEE